MFPNVRPSPHLPSGSNMQPLSGSPNSTSKRKSLGCYCVAISTYKTQQKDYNTLQAPVSLQGLQKVMVWENSGKVISFREQRKWGWTEILPFLTFGPKAQIPGRQNNFQSKHCLDAFQRVLTWFWKQCK